VDLERELVQAHFQRVYGRGFEYAFLYPGMSKVIQAAGRVIRTETDRGVVVLVGERFATPRYTGLFPRDWYRRHPRELICPDPYGELRAFWEAMDAADGAWGEKKKRSNTESPESTEELAASSVLSV